ncbi:hypothetical protein SLEP1_g13707 [Rubroshorea leprosula]|uniref:Plant heme peroxidase family profile domain-containing protein n=1 Tax=Rubroshorea leprosula TaxID=152421 RepID=A0AAV5IGU0_9ROSI|nr:hypothetical protein SLEP1_g13707 [Rubroshorea leprosula]
MLWSSLMCASNTVLELITVLILLRKGSTEYPGGSTEYLGGSTEYLGGSTEYLRGLLEPLKEQFPILSHADFYQLAGVVAVEVTGGPEVPFHPGREDKPQPPPEGRLPDATKG